jgi:hypothetical protein
MLGYKPKIFKCHTTVSLDDLVPQDNFYRQIEAKLDLSFVQMFGSIRNSNRHAHARGV